MRGSLPILLALVLAAYTPAQAQDFGVPDSVYYESIDFHPGMCAGEVQVHMSIYLWTDRPALFYYTDLEVSGHIGCDSIVPRFLVSCDASDAPTRCSYSDTIGFASKCYSGYITPGNGVAGDLYFRANAGDTLWVEPVFPTLFSLSDLSNVWWPLEMDLDTQLVVPTSFDLPPGDANASGDLAISDAVFIVNYIFGGGCPPYDANAADADKSCSISIADAVYLINYIFGGGPAPLPGCVEE